MKKPLRLLACVCLALTALHASSPQAARATVPAPVDPAAPGAQFVDLLAKGDFAAAVGRFDATMKAALPEDKLRATWQTLIQQAGPFQKQLRTRTADQAGYKIVLVTCQFEKAALDAKVVFDTQGRVAGLFFAPTPPDAAAFKTPAYAQADAYREQEITVGKGDWSLPGTLTMPTGAGGSKGAMPAVVLVQGSGPNDRDETIEVNKPFRDLAWGLATRGIAVLRYEKRTRQYAVRLAANLGGFTVREETIDDALTAAAQLRKTEGVDPQRVFVLGHSLGATIMPRIGQADPALAGLVMLAGATRPLEDLIVEQTQYLLSLAGPLSKEDQAKVDALQAEVDKVKKLTPADAAAPGLILNAPPAYWLDLRGHDELAIAKTLKLPLLILQGARDYQVTTEDFAGWKKALAAQPNVTFKLYPNLNHLFMAGEGKSTPAEYQKAGNVDEAVVKDIADWILKTPAQALPGMRPSETRPSETRP